MIPEAISNPGVFVLPFPEVFELCFWLGACSMSAVVFPLLDLFCVSFTNIICTTQSRYKVLICGNYIFIVGLIARYFVFLRSSLYGA